MSIFLFIALRFNASKLIMAGVFKILVVAEVVKQNGFL
jgi:hypothetical protein